MKLRIAFGIGWDPLVGHIGLDGKLHREPGVGFFFVQVEDEEEAGSSSPPADEVEEQKTGRGALKPPRLAEARQEDGEYAEYRRDWEEQEKGDNDDVLFANSPGLQVVEWEIPPELLAELQRLGKLLPAEGDYLEGQRAGEEQDTGDIVAELFPVELPDEVWKVIERHRQVGLAH